MEKKIKVLALCDSPTSATGFAQVSRNIFRGLYETGKYHFDIIGINFNGEYYDRELYPYNIYPAEVRESRDMYGRDRFMLALNGHMDKLKPPWDIIFTIQDPFIIEGMGSTFAFGDQLRVSQELWKRTVDPALWFNWIGYFPVDAPLKENWVNRAITLPNYPVMYCQWGKKKVLEWDKDPFLLKFNIKRTEDADKKDVATISIAPLKDRAKVIPHGVDIKNFKPLPEKEKKEFRKAFFKDLVDENTYIISNISRNQPRKDIPRTMLAFSYFKKGVKNAHLYLHCQEDDVGGSIDEYARQFNLVLGKDYSVPDNFNAGDGYTLDILNKIYNITDMCVTTTLGEGWGFITSEAMATKTPILAPNITSILDIFDSYEFENDIDHIGLLTTEKHLLRGIPVKAGSTASEWVALGITDMERIRPLTNVDDLVQKMLWVHSHPKEVGRIVERGYKWVQDLSWDVVCKQWDELFMEAYKDIERQREVGRRIDTARRNDPCPCGSGKKFKRCHGNPDKLALFDDWFEKKDIKSI